MMSAAVEEILWEFSSSRIRGRPEGRGACVRGVPDRVGWAAVARIGWPVEQCFCRLPSFPPGETRLEWASAGGCKRQWLCPPLFSSVLMGLH